MSQGEGEWIGIYWGVCGTWRYAEGIIAACGCWKSILVKISRVLVQHLLNSSERLLEVYT